MKETFRVLHFIPHVPPSFGLWYKSHFSFVRTPGTERPLSGPFFLKKI